MIGVTIIDNSKFFEMARVAAFSVMRKAKIPIFIHVCSPIKNLKTKKHDLFDMFPDQTIFYFDADTIMLQFVDMSQFEDQEDFIAVRDQHIAGHEDLKKFNLDANLYFNNGVMIFNKRHRHISQFLESNELKYNAKLGGQTRWNLAIKHLNIPLRLLDARWNWLRYNPKNSPKDVIIGHYTFNNNREGQKQRNEVLKAIR